MFYLRLYGVEPMVNDNVDSKRGNPMPPLHGLLFSISSFFYMHHPTDRIAHTMTFVTPVEEHWLKREIVHWVHGPDQVRGTPYLSNYVCNILKCINSALCMGRKDVRPPPSTVLIEETSPDTKPKL